ncbi:MAG: alcohol dehydrogenase catalytic domain-containing protein [Nocardioides sp.]
MRVHVTTVNRTDCAYRSGYPWINRVVCGWPRPRVQVLGSEYAGVVVGVGEGVTSHAVGDRALGHGATGAIGTGLVQLLHAEGVEVTAVCDQTPAGQPDLLAELGAADVVSLAEGDGLTSVRGGFGAVVDATGHFSAVVAVAAA